jgi:hypothetical protein
MLPEEIHVAIAQVAALLRAVSASHGLAMAQNVAEKAMHQVKVG